MPKPVINKKICAECNNCIVTCPMDVFGKENNKVVVKKPKECIGCRVCEIQCPKKAIEIIDD